MSFDRQSEVLAVVQETAVHAPGSGHARLHRVFELTDTFGKASGLIARLRRFELGIDGGNGCFRPGRFLLFSQVNAGSAGAPAVLLRERLQLHPAFAAEQLLVGVLRVAFRTTFHGCFLLKKVRIINDIILYPRTMSNSNRFDGETKKKI